MKPSRMPTITSNHSKNKWFKLLPGREKKGEYPVPDQARKKVLAAFQKTAGIRFKSLGLLNLSFMHRSVSNETANKINNERLEFLGDAILGAVSATLLYENLASRPEGDLARIKSVVVSEDVLSALALELKIDSLLILGRGEELSGGREKKAILADALEALIGAIYLDSGYKNAFSFVSRLINTEINRVLENQHHLDYKSLLQEFCQRQYKNYPTYRIVQRSGPEHSRIFWVEVAVNNNVFGPASGKSKKTAEREAAKMAWEALNPDLPQDLV